MIKKKYLWLTILFLYSAVPFLNATTNHGGRGLIYTNSARVIPQGYLQFYMGTRFFGKVASFGADKNAYTLWTVKGLSSFNYGINSHLELAVSPVFYLDTNRGGSGLTKESVNFPDDLFISLKLASFNRLESPYFFGVLLHSRIPIADKHNIIYEPYSAGTLEAGVTGLFSYYSNITFPDEGWSFHGNLGYLNHNDAGEEISEVPDAPTPESMSSEVVINLGALFPAGNFDFSTELSFRSFLSKPSISAYSMESVSYFTMGIYYKPYQWITVEMGIDLRLFSGEDESDYSLTPADKPNLDFPNYPGWRGLLGVKLALLPGSLYAKTDKAVLQDKITDRQEILERMMRGQENTDNAEEEIARIRAEREKVEAELRRLRQLLEGEKKDNQDD